MATAYDLTVEAPQTVVSGSGSWASGVQKYYHRFKVVPVDGDTFKLWDLAKGEAMILAAMKVITGGNGTAPTISLGIDTAGMLVASPVTAAAVTAGTNVYYSSTAASVMAPAAVLTSAVPFIATYASGGGSPTTEIEIEVELITIKSALV